MSKRTLAVLPLSALLSGCTVFSAHAASDPPRVESKGVVDGHLALGIPATDEILGAELFRGRSPGAFLRLNILKLVRLELGLLGATVGVGPLDAGLGIVAYKPLPPEGRAKPKVADAALDEPLETNDPVLPPHPTNVIPIHGDPR